GCTGFVMMMKAFAAQGAHTRRAAAVAVSSVSAGEGWPGGAAYCAAKGALSAAARALDVELSPKGIRVAALEPRYVLTRMFRGCAGRMGVPEAAAMPPETFAQEVMDRVESGLRGA
ncbi:MAG: SDR family oxidoreductase, partial [Bacteroidales bacterium]|nr:SDR family oxidoreductase [Bacteroidales bacterium]